MIINLNCLKSTQLHSKIVYINFDDNDFRVDSFNNKTIVSCWKSIDRTIHFFVSINDNNVKFEHFAKSSQNSIHSTKKLWNAQCVHRNNKSFTQHVMSIMIACNRFFVFVENKWFACDRSWNNRWNFSISRCVEVDSKFFDVVIANNVHVIFLSFRRDQKNTKRKFVFIEQYVVRTNRIFVRDSWFHCVQIWRRRRKFRFVRCRCWIRYQKIRRCWKNDQKQTSYRNHRKFRQ